MLKHSVKGFWNARKEVRDGVINEDTEHDYGWFLIAEDEKAETKVSVVDFWKNRINYLTNKSFSVGIYNIY